MQFLDIWNGVVVEKFVYEAKCNFLFVAHSAEVEQIQLIEQQTKKLDEEFRSLVGLARAAILLQDHQPSDFMEKVSRLGPDHQAEHRSFIKEDLINLPQTATVDKIWISLNTYWNYLNYGLLEHVIKEFNIKDLEQKLKSYVEKLKTFKRDTKLCDFVQYCRRRHDHVPSIDKLKKLEVKMDHPDWSRCTLWEVEEFKRTLISKFFFPNEFLLIFKEATDGCICITWLILPTVATALHRGFISTSSEFFKENGIVAVTLDGQQCYPMKDEPVTPAGNAEKQIEAEPHSSLPSLEEVLGDIPPEKLDQPCQDKHLCEIAGEITNWPILAPFLEIKAPEVEAIRGKWPFNIPAQNLELLRRWQDKRGRKATYGELCKSFLKAKETRLAERVSDFCIEGGSCEGENDDPDEVFYDALEYQPSPAPGPISVSNDPLELYADYLRMTYDIQTQGFVVLQWPPPLTLRVFNLAMIRSQELGFSYTGRGSTRFACSSQLRITCVRSEPPKVERSVKLCIGAGFVAKYVSAPLALRGTIIDTGGCLT